MPIWQSHGVSEPIICWSPPSAAWAPFVFENREKTSCSAVLNLVHYNHLVGDIVQDRRHALRFAPVVVASKTRIGKIVGLGGEAKKHSSGTLEISTFCTRRFSKKRGVCGVNVSCSPLEMVFSNAKRPNGRPFGVRTRPGTSPSRRPHVWHWRG